MEQSQVAECAHKTGEHSATGRDVRKSQESCTVPASVPPVNTLPRAHVRRLSNISADCKTYAGSIHLLGSRDLLTTAEDH